MVKVRLGNLNGKIKQTVKNGVCERCDVMAGATSTLWRHREAPRNHARSHERFEVFMTSRNQKMTCMNTGNAWVRVRKGERQKGSWRAFTTLWVVGGRPWEWRKTIFPGARFRAFSFARRLAVACLHRPPGLSPEKLRSDWWMEWTRPEQPIDRHRIRCSWPSQTAFQGWLCLDNTRMIWFALPRGSVKITCLSK